MRTNTRPQAPFLLAITLVVSLFMIAPGMSGNPLSPWFGHLAGRWSEGQYVRITGSAEQVAEGGAGTILIEPKR